MYPMAPCRSASCSGSRRLPSSRRPSLSDGPVRRRPVHLRVARVAAARLEFPPADTLTGLACRCRAIYRQPLHLVVTWM